MSASSPTARVRNRRSFAACTLVALLLARSAWAQGSDPFPRTAIPDMPNARPAERLPVFFPPNPPPLGRPVMRGVPAGSRNSAPPELAAYVCEFFYPALGTRLSTKTLNEKLRGQLESYHAARFVQETELRTELDRLRGAEPAARKDALAAFSQRQTPRLTELEKLAEQLRRDLITADQNWGALREWHLSDKQRRGFSPLEIAQVMRAFAFYHHHLLPAQRRLLREISLELMFAADSTAAATAAQPFFFFPPEPARVTFPDDLPAEVAAKVASYQTKKSALKKELFDTVSASDGATLAFLRGNPIKALADKQAARLAELDRLAEEIRAGLTGVPEPRAERSPLSVALDARVAALMQGHLAAQKQSAAQIESILAASKDVPLQASYRFEGDGLKFQVIPSRGSRGGGPAGGGAARVDAVRAQVAAIADDYGRRLVELLTEREAIRAEIGQALGLTKADAIDRALQAAIRVTAQKETEGTFADYRVAVFEPGLSPEQRRLLFANVVERLALPLPRGELQPSMRAATW